ncbi:MAG TPA: hypothetical protein VG938_16920 [Verrucomicrobiae bacterium]|jgi:hypothetical protein|nr:hypothetical protein [Verrucomicrobiae bacterium]
MNREQTLRKIKWLTWLFIFGLILSGVTAIPLQTELDAVAKLLGGTDMIHQANSTGLALWIYKVRDAVHSTYFSYEFMAYGTDWLAFGHFVIAIAFVGALREPIRNRWLYQFGMIACALVIPYAMVMGGLRGIPVGWRLIDCSFGALGFVPLWLCWRWTGDLEKSPEVATHTATKPGA